MADVDELRDVRCADRRGFLFDHPCERMARVRCAGCQKPICEHHRHVRDNLPYCTDCAQQSGGSDWDTPYFYGRRHYAGYQSYWLYDGDPDYDDFTDADGASTQTDGDDAFENDLGAS